MLTVLLLAALPCSAVQHSKWRQRGSEMEVIAAGVNVTNCSPLKVLQVASIQDDCVTQLPMKNGFGSQYVGLMSAMAWAGLHKKAFCNTAFQTVAHNQDVKICNTLTGFPAGRDCHHCYSEKEFFLKIQRELPTHRLLEAYTPCLRKQLRESFDQGVEKLGLEPVNFDYSNRTVVNVAVHIRRGDIMNEFMNKGHDIIPNSAYRKAIAHVREILWKNNQTANFQVFSEGSSKSFKNIVEGHDDVQLQLLGDDGALETFVSMVKADILLMAPSSLSWAAAFLRIGGQVVSCR
mmetsp:Transcript_47526/g.78747  ORF Transcript_47526/g.78747 Transcript_47526/m.78747 type:complete len:291 (-) Transcript_47526:481-1353(-)